MTHHDFPHDDDAPRPGGPRRRDGLGAEGYGPRHGQRYSHDRARAHRGRGEPFAEGFDPREIFAEGFDPRKIFREGFDPREIFAEGFDPRSLIPEGFGDPRRERRGGRRGGRGPHRAPRGDVRTAVLLLLQTEPMHGYQLMQTIAERTGGRWAPSPGAIYPTLSQLEDEGLVEVTKEGGRKLATLTEAGRAHVEEHSPTWENPFPEADGGSTEDLRGLVRELQGAVREVSRVGTDAQNAEAARILTESRRSLYRLLAEDTSEPDDTAAPGDARGDDQP